MTLNPGNPMRVVLLSVLFFEAIVFGLAIPVMVFLSDVPLGASLGFGGAAALFALVSAGLMRRPAGYLLGWVTQVVAVLLGLLTATMYVIGAMFAALWLVSFLLGKRLEDRTTPA